MGTVSHDKHRAPLGETVPPVSRLSTTGNSAPIDQEGEEGVGR